VHRTRTSCFAGVTKRNDNIHPKPILSFVNDPRVSLQRAVPRSVVMYSGCTELVIPAMATRKGFSVLLSDMSLTLS